MESPGVKLKKSASKTAFSSHKRQNQQTFGENVQCSGQNGQPNTLAYTEDLPRYPTAVFVNDDVQRPPCTTQGYYTTTGAVQYQSAPTSSYQQSGQTDGPVLQDTYQELGFNDLNIQTDLCSMFADTNTVQRSRETSIVPVTTTASATANSVPLHTVRSEERQVEDLEAEIITAAAAAEKTTPARKSPSVPTRVMPAPVKRMKSVESVGKRISSNKKQFVRGNDETESDGYFEDHAAMDGRDSSSDSDASAVNSDEGERVRSPVSAKSTSKKKEKRKRASRSPSTSSSESSVKTDFSRRSRASHASHKHKKIRRPEQEEQKKTVEKRSKDDPSRKRHTSHRHETREKSRSVSKSPAPSVTRSPARHRTQERITTTPSRVMPPPPTDAAATNDLYVSILNAKASYNVVPEQDALSKSTIRSKRVYSRRQVSATEQPIGTPTPQRVESDQLTKMLDEKIRNTELSAETVKMVANMFATKTAQSRKNLIAEALQLVKSYPVQPIELPSGSPALEKDYPKIDATSYLFSAMKTNFGYNFEAIQKREDSASRTLFWALSMKVNKKKNSLDFVFRKSLKELVKEIHVFDEFGENSLDNPMFISGRYLELTLLEKIRTFYKNTINEDIVGFFARACPDEKSQLTDLVGGSVCEKYLRQLYDRYAATVISYDKALVETLGIIQMRVWTNRKNQGATNIMFLNYLSSVFQALTAAWTQLSDGERRARMMIKEFCAEYVKRMRPFLYTHKTFLAEMLQASELMAWVCVGITMDDLETGFRNMAISYYMIENESQKDYNDTNPYICWNYPLASKYKHEQRVASIVRMPEPDDYWNDLQNVILDDPSAPEEVATPVYNGGGATIQYRQQIPGTLVTQRETLDRQYPAGPRRPSSVL